MHLELEYLKESLQSYSRFEQLIQEFGFSPAWKDPHSLADARFLNCTFAETPLVNFSGSVVIPHNMTDDDGPLWFIRLTFYLQDGEDRKETDIEINFNPDEEPMFSFSDEFEGEESPAIPSVKFFLADLFANISRQQRTDKRLTEEQAVVFIQKFCLFVKKETEKV